MKEYPYFIYPCVMALRDGTPDEEEAARLRRIIAANIGDMPSLRLLLGIDPEEFANFYPDMEKVNISTLDTIDSFLTKFGNADAPTPQAAAEIPEETPSENYPDETQKPAADEDMARELIKNHNYQPALEIIMQLSLNNPEKSIYFADQIRFLRKLILNEAKQNKP